MRFNSSDKLAFILGKLGCSQKAMTAGTIPSAF
jgi:hypothetical protein